MSSKNVIAVQMCPSLCTCVYVTISAADSSKCIQNCQFCFVTKALSSSLPSSALPSIVIYLPSYLFLSPNSRSAQSAPPPHDFCPYPAQLLSLPSLFTSASTMSKFSPPSVTASFFRGQNAAPACQLSCHPSFSICCLFVCKMPGRKLRYWSSKKDKEDGLY